MWHAEAERLTLTRANGQYRLLALAFPEVRKDAHPTALRAETVDLSPFDLALLAHHRLVEIPGRVVLRVPMLVAECLLTTPTGSCRVEDLGPDNSRQVEEFRRLLTAWSPGRTRPGAPESAGLAGTSGSIGRPTRRWGRDPDGRCWARLGRARSRRTWSERLAPRVPGLGLLHPLAEPSEPLLVVRLPGLRGVRARA